MKRVEVIKAGEQVREAVLRNVEKYVGKKDGTEERSDRK